MEDTPNEFDEKYNLTKNFSMQTLTQELKPVVLKNYEDENPKQ